MAAYLITLILFIALFIYRETLHARERRDWDQKERELLNRIKPETAVMLPNETRPEKLHIGFDADEEWEAYEAGVDR